MQLLYEVNYRQHTHTHAHTHTHTHENIKRHHLLYTRMVTITIITKQASGYRISYRFRDRTIAFRLPIRSVNTTV